MLQRTMIDRMSSSKTKKASQYLKLEWVLFSLTLNVLTTFTAKPFHVQQQNLKKLSKTFYLTKKQGFNLFSSKVLKYKEKVITKSRIKLPKRVFN